MPALHHAVIAATICLFATQGRAQSTEEGTGLVCDTAQQVSEVMTAYDKSRDWNASLVSVNAEKIVCAVMAGGIRPVSPEKQVTIFRPKGQDT